MELVSASGLNMPTEQIRDPLAATTYGTGVLIAEAVRTEPGPQKAADPATVQLLSLRQERLAGTLKRDLPERRPGWLDSQAGQGKIISGILARSGPVPVYAVVASVDEDLGSYASNFADIITASDGPAMEAAGAQLEGMR